MLLREIIAESGLTLRAFAARVDCSHNHLLQVAQLKKNIGSALGSRIKRFDQRFSIEQQVEAFEAAGGAAERQLVEARP